jgi:MFS family permease
MTYAFIITWCLLGMMLGIWLINTVLNEHYSRYEDANKIRVKHLVWLPIFAFVGPIAFCWVIAIFAAKVWIWLGKKYHATGFRKRWRNFLNKKLLE